MGGRGITACLCILSSSAIATTPAGSCGGFLYQYPPKENGVTAPRPALREGAKPCLAIQALLKAETHGAEGQWDKAGDSFKSWGCHLTDQAVHCKQVSLRGAEEGERQDVKRRLVSSSAIQGHKNFPRRRFVLRTKAWYITMSSQSIAMGESFYFLSGAFILFLIADNSLDAFSPVSQCNRKTAPRCTVLS